MDSKLGLFLSSYTPMANVLRGAWNFGAILQVHSNFG